MFKPVRACISIAPSTPGDTECLPKMNAVGVPGIRVNCYEKNRQNRGIDSSLL